MLRLQNPDSECCYVALRMLRLQISFASVVDCDLLFCSQQLLLAISICKFRVATSVCEYGGKCNVAELCFAMCFGGIGLHVLV